MIPDEPVPEGKRFVLNKGALLCARYEILQLLGEGGMGAVYKARDRELTGEGRDELIAIKVILPKFSDQPLLVRRFREEILLARHITHKNVVRIFNLEKDRDLLFLTMEFVEGEDLSALLKARGKYAPREAAEIMYQVARGMQAAHEANVIHRDLKTRNIMIERTGRVVVMDFGLARPLDRMGETQTVAVMGTPGYMPPEQMAMGQVDHRSDIYSFGVTFFEILTGEFPHASRKTLVPGGTTKVTPRPGESIPHELDRIIRKCLAVNPDERYQSADELATEISGWLHPAVRKKSRTSRAAVLVIAGICALLVTAISLYFWRTHAKRAPPKAVSLLIADFDNRTGDPVFSGGTLESVLSFALESAPFITSFNRGQAHQDAQQLSGTADLTEQLAQTVAVREGVQDIVAGLISPDGAGYALAVRVVEAGSNVPIFSRDFTASSKQALLGGLNSIAARILDAFGQRDAPAYKAETFTASSLPAIHSYAVAQELMLEGKQADAIPHYLEAIQLDPDFGRAYAGLAALYRNLGMIDEAFRYYGEALRHIDRMTDREKFRTRGGYYITAGEPDKAMEEFTELIKQYPADNAGLANLALTWFFRRDMWKALEYGRKAVEIYPKNVAQRNNVAFYAMYAGDFKTAIDEAREALKLNPGYEKAYIATALSHLGEGNAGEARKTYERLETVSPYGASLASLGLADVEMYEGHAQAAIDALNREPASKPGIRNASLAAMNLLTAAQCYVLLGKTKQASDNVAKALVGQTSPAILFPAARVYMRIQPEKTKELAAVLERSSRPDSRAYGGLIQGEMYLEYRDAQSAIGEFQKAQQIADTWLGRFDLARAYVQAGDYPEADTEAETCLRRRGEAAAVFLDDIPSYRYFPAVFYYQARAEEGLKSRGAAKLYRAFLLIKKNADRDPLVDDARRRVGVE